MKRISILGSTGSIGVQTLEVAENLSIQVLALTGNLNIGLLEAQARKFKPQLVAVMDEEQADILRGNLRDTDISVLAGLDGIISAATLQEADTVVNSLVGNIGLRPTIAAIRAGKDICLANKETLVTAGEIIMREVKAAGVRLHPIDSEHSAIFQCLRGNENNRPEKIYLTASGGPFRGKALDELKNVKASDALRHPNWTMGAKITIDSATMMNKGLEVIEARWLFDMTRDKIQVLVHPQSVIHSMVEYEDGAVMAQLGCPDMRVPIQYALCYPARPKNNFPKMDFLANHTLSFEAPDLKSFRCLQLAYDALDTGGTLPAVMNAANEVTVAAFLQNKISFLRISQIIESAMAAYTVKYDFGLDEVLAADAWGRNFAEQSILNTHDF